MRAMSNVDEQAQEAIADMLEAIIAKRAAG